LSNLNHIIETPAPALWLDTFKIDVFFNPIHVCLLWTVRTTFLVHFYLEKIKVIWSYTPPLHVYKIDLSIFKLIRSKYVTYVW